MDLNQNILIIGNGFDLDLGLPTKFSDFAQSSFWPRAKKREKIPNLPSYTSRGSFIALPPLPETILLEHYLDDIRNQDCWFDLEGALLNYSTVNADKKIVDAGAESDDTVKTNVEYFKRMQDSLCKYITHVQNNAQINHNSVAGKTLQTIMENGFFNHIYSFNYTELNYFAGPLGITKNIYYHHIHGAVSDNSIILGVDETELRNGYELFHKSSSKYYHSHDLYNSLSNAKEIVFFGLSFGKIDYSYFDRFFKSLSDGVSIENEKKKYITIFTKDDHSRLDILTRLREMNINVQRLYAQCHFQIICTDDGLDSNEFFDFQDRLYKNRLMDFKKKKSQ